MSAALEAALAGLPRDRLATLPAPLEDGRLLPGGARLLVKRKLELLAAAAHGAQRGEHGPPIVAVDVAKEPGRVRHARIGRSRRGIGSVEQWLP